MPSGLRQRISTSLRATARADVDDRLIVCHELANLERAFDLGNRIFTPAPRQQDRERKDDDREKSVTMVPNACRSRWLAARPTGDADVVARIA